MLPGLGGFGFLGFMQGMKDWKRTWKLLLRVQGFLRNEKSTVMQRLFPTNSSWVQPAPPLYYPPRFPTLIKPNYP